MIRCLVVDDSRAFRAILRTILARAPGVEVVGEAADGDDAVSKVLQLRPDVVTMDVRMPGKDGLAAIEEIMRLRPTPVVVVSAEAGPEKQELAFRALDLGAIEVLAKPRTTANDGFERDAEAIRMAVRAVAGLKLVTRRPRRSARATTPVRTPAQAAADAVARARPALTPWPPPPAIRAPPRVLGIVASTGGPPAVARILHGLPRDFPIPVLIVQHIANGFDAGLAHWLDGETALRVELAVDRAPLARGTVYIAPGGVHLGAAGDVVRLVPGAPVGGFRPAGTVLLSMLAREYGPAAAGLVLSGMGDDGAAGLADLRARGGWTAAQGPRSSVVFGMPRVAIDRGAAERTIELDDISGALLRLARVEGA
jgi:two-component system chemotaxis response regulator CheB